MQKAWLPFVGPFAVLGAIGGLLTMVKLGGSSRLDSAGLALLLVTPLTASLLGAILARGRRKWKALALSFPLLVVTAGAFNGVCIAAVVLLLTGDGQVAMVPFGAVFGAVCGVAFVPPMLWTFLAAVRIGSARQGSLLDVVHRRAPWAAVAASVSVAVWAVHRTPGESPQPVSGVAAIVMGVGLVTLVAVLVADVVALARASRRAELATTPIEPAVDRSHGSEVLDLGVGEELLAEQWTGAGSAYRPESLRVASLRGSVALAQGQLVRIVAIDALATCAALACIARLAV